MSVTIPTRPTRRRRPSLLATLTAVGCVLAIAGCGSSGHKPGASSHASAGLAFSECMRSHGVTGFPDPNPGGGGLNIAGTGINPSSPSFQAARVACQKLLPGGGPGSRHATEQQKQILVAIARCMRSHGVTGFPDPTTTRPTNPQGYSIVQGIADNLFLLVPATINVNSPAFKQAAQTCNFR
ncbi:MAG TPA: hypothetical protein VGL51_00415 [Solirubrobacteraceae bacterium]|jgi:hypothetical protein